MRHMVKHLINKACAAEFSGETMAKNLLEPSLMVIVSVPSRFIDSSHIHHRIQRVQHLQENLAQTSVDPLDKKEPLSGYKIITSLSAH